MYFSQLKKQTPSYTTNDAEIKIQSISSPLNTSSYIHKMNLTFTSKNNLHYKLQYN